MLAQRGEGLPTSGQGYATLWPPYSRGLDDFFVPAS
jgi:hypothetical protein